MQRLLPVVYLLCCGCTTAKQVLPYDGPFKADHEYATVAPVAVWLGDMPFESGFPQPTPASRAVRDADVLAPDTHVRFVRKDHPYLVFLILTGDAKGRYAWLDQHSEDIRSFQELVTAPR